MRRKAIWSSWIFSFYKWNLGQRNWVRCSWLFSVIVAEMGWEPVSWPQHSSCHPAFPGWDVWPHRPRRPKYGGLRGSQVGSSRSYQNMVHLGGPPTVSYHLERPHGTHRKGSDLLEESAAKYCLPLFLVWDKSFGFSQWSNPGIYNLIKPPHVHF